MKLPSLLVVTASVVLLLSAELAFGQTQQLLTEAQQSYMRKDYATAKAQFETVLRMDPKNATAIGFLRRIAAEAQQNAGGTTERQLAAVIVPKVDLREATLGSVLEYLKQVVTKASNGKTSVNFIVQVPEERVKTQAVTLSVSNIPFTEVLRYLGGLADVQFEYEKYAVVVKPRGGGGGGVPAASQPPATVQ